MPEPTARRCLIICALIAILAAGIIAGLDSYGSRSRIVGKSATINSPEIVKFMVDNPLEAYRIWKESGYRGRAIVFVSDRWESFDPVDLTEAPMSRPYPLELYSPARLLEESHLDGVTFLYVASMNKIVRKIVAILPEQEIRRMKVMAQNSKDSRTSESGIYVSRQGYPRWFTTGDHFTGVGEPALLYVGASSFRFAEPETLYRQLTAAGLFSDCVVLCRETGKDSVTPAEIAKLDRFARLIGLTIATSRTASLPSTRTLTSPLP